MNQFYFLLRNDIRNMYGDTQTIRIDTIQYINYHSMSWLNEISDVVILYQNMQKSPPTLFQAA